MYIYLLIDLATFIHYQLFLQKISPAPRADFRSRWSFWTKSIAFFVALMLGASCCRHGSEPFTEMPWKCHGNAMEMDTNAHQWIPIYTDGLRTKMQMEN